MLVPIVFCADADYGLYLPAAVQSIIENSSYEHEYHIIIFDCGIKPADLAVLQRQIDGRENFSLQIKSVAAALAARGPSKAQQKFMRSPATLGRLLAPEFCPDYSKVIYADIDMVFNLDMAGLMQEDLAGAYIGGVIDIDLEAERFLAEPAAKENEAYINAGLAVMNLDAWRAHDLAEKALQFLLAGERRFLDQDAINFVCKGHIHYLAEKWNSLRTSHPWYERNIKRLSARRSPYLDKILRHYAAAYADARANIHWTGWLKPWMNRHMAFADIWWDYARRTENYGIYLEDLLFNKARLLRGDKNVLYCLFGLPLLRVKTKPDARKYYVFGMKNGHIAELRRNAKSGGADFFLFGLKLGRRRAAA